MRDDCPILVIPGVSRHTAKRGTRGTMQVFSFSSVGQQTNLHFDVF